MMVSLRRTKLKTSSTRHSILSRSFNQLGAPSEELFGTEPIRLSKDFPPPLPHVSDALTLQGCISPSETPKKSEMPRGCIIVRGRGIDYSQND